MLSPGNFEGVKAVAKIRRRRHVVRVVSNNYKSPKYHSFLLLETQYSSLVFT